MRRSQHVFLPWNGIKKTADGMYWRPEREASAFARDNGPGWTLFLPPFHLRLARKCNSTMPRGRLSTFDADRGLRAGKPVKSARIGCRFRVLREWNKGKFIRRHRRAERPLAVDKAPQFGPNILHFRDFFPPAGNGFGGPIMPFAR
jgi:hypothetical protein